MEESRSIDRSGFLDFPRFAGSARNDRVVPRIIRVSPARIGNVRMKTPPKPVATLGASSFFLHVQCPRRVGLGMVLTCDWGDGWLGRACGPGRTPS